MWLLTKTRRLDYSGHHVMADSDIADMVLVANNLKAAVLVEGGE